MSEKSKLIPEPVALLEEALRKRKEADALRASIEEARSHAMELKVKIETILGIPTVEEAKGKLSLGNMKEFKDMISDNRISFMTRFSVPVEDTKEKILVNVAKTPMLHAYSGENMLDITIPALSTMVTLEERGNGTIRSISRDGKPFTMEDYRKFDALLDRLAKPDVVKEEVSRPKRRLR